VPDLWCIFFLEFVKQNPDSLLHFMFVNQSGVDNIEAIREFTIAQIAIEESIKLTKIVGNKEHLRLTQFVDNNLLGALRLQLDWNKNSVLNNEKYGFDNRIVHLVKFFQDYLIDNSINVVCIDMVSQFTSLECRVLEKVCKEMKVKVLVSPTSSMYGRIEIFDNTNRISHTAAINYKSLLDGGMNNSQLEKLEIFLQSYKITKKRFHGEAWLNALKNNKASYFYKTKKIVKSLMNLLTRKVPINLNIKHRNIAEFSNTPYFVFLPNKKNNHRTYNCSPFHSDYASIIKAISISLPIGYSLLIKDHPHQIKKINPNNNLLNAIMSTDNCHYLSFHTDYYNLIENSVGIFTSASSSAIESLMAKKHVIAFGSEPYIFGSNPLAPIHRITNLEKLPFIINNCISSPVDKDKINAYLFSLLSSSSSIEKTDEDSDFVSFQPDNKRREYIHIVKLINEFIR